MFSFEVQLFFTKQILLLRKSLRHYARRVLAKKIFVKTKFARGFAKKMFSSGLEFFFAKKILLMKRTCVLYLWENFC